MNVTPSKNLRKNSPIWTICKQVFDDWFQEYGVHNGKLQIPKAKLDLIVDSLVIEFNQNDFLNPSSFKGFTKYYKCNSGKPKYQKRYLGKQYGLCHMIGFKIVDYDNSKNVLIISNPNFLKILGAKRREEFVSLDKDGNVQGYPAHLYLGDDDVPYDYKYNREWEYIRGLTPQEKIVLANLHGEDPFPDSFYENDRGSFQRRVIESEYDSRLESELVNISDIRDYEANENDDAFDIMDKTIMEREMSFQEARDGFDYGDFQEFSDLYTRTPTGIEDFELYPIRINCLPKSIRKKGKSPYDSKLGVREWRWFNYYQKPKPLDSWKKIPEVKEMFKAREEANKARLKNEEADLMANSDVISDDIWAEIEMAYQMR